VTTLRPLTGIAKRVYDDIMSLEPEAAAEYARMVVWGALQHDMEVHQDVLQHRIDTIVSKRAAYLKEGVVRTYVSKRASGDDVDHLHRVAEVVSKAGFGSLTTEERRRFAQLQGHDPRTGQFKSKTKIIRYNDRAKPMSGRFAGSIGMQEDKAKHLSRRDRAQYHQAYLQLAGMLDEFTEVPAGTATVSLLYRKGPLGGLERVSVPYVPGQKPDDYLDASKFKGPAEKKLVEASVIVDGGLNVEGAAFNLVGGLTGSPAAGGRAARAMTLDPETGKAPGLENFKTFAEDWDTLDAEDVRNPSSRVFRRMRAGSKLLSDLAGPTLPYQAQMALRTAEIAGQYGPEAQKVIGPHADRAAYRYRGVEKRPDPGLQSVVSSSSRDQVIYGKWERHGHGPAVHQESKLVSYFQNRLPDAELMHLQRKSGTIPPSEGVIIDKKGKVVTQAVGYGDDWYLPFNLKTLSKLRGGDYIRTRTFGGPTTEDIYTGLMSGARSVTVVSHNGVFTIEFDESFRGTRRYSDKAGRMVKRYGHLLDAVKSQDVRLAEIPAERMRDLHAMVAAEGLNPRDRTDRKEYDERLSELIEEEKRDPQLSEAQKRKLAEDFVNAKASHMKTQDGYAADWTALAQEEIGREVASRRAQHNALYGHLSAPLTAPQFVEEEARQYVAAGFATPEAVIGSKGWNDEFEEVLSRAESEERAKRSPLELNGMGYHKSMEALQQQFPYYITNVDWRNRDPKGFDYGYVKPRFNRPEGALVGYYDTSIEGIPGLPGPHGATGKLTADTVRHQNRLVTALPSRDKTPAKVEEKAQATEAPAAGGRPDQDLEAMVALRRELRGRTSITDPNTGRATAIGPVRNQLDDNMRWLYAMDDRTFLEEARRNPAAAKKGLLEDVRTFMDKGFGSVPQDSVDRLERPEQAKKGREWDLVEMMLGNAMDVTYDFGDEVGPGRTPAQYQRVAESKKAKIHVGEKQDIDDYIREQYRFYQAALGSEGRLRPSHAPRYEQNIRNAMIYKQALRRKDEAEKHLADQADLERREREAAMRDRDIVIQTNDPSTARHIASGQDPRVIDGSAERREDDQR
jgi:hypothetical protein